MADYSTLTSVKGELNITDSNDDIRIARLITAASRAIDGWCKRPDGGFVATTEARYFDVPQHLSGPVKYTRDATLSASVASGTWPDTLVSTVDIDPLLSATLVQTDDSGDGTFATTWAPGTDYYFLPLNAGQDGYPYRQLRVNPNGARQLPIGPRALSIQGTWGYALLTPAAIEEACILLVIRWLERPRAPFGVMGSADTGLIRLPQLDPDVRKILEDAGYIQPWVFA